MAVNKKSLENLDMGRFKRNTRETQQKIARKGAEASNKKQAENKQKALEREEVVEILTRVFNAPVDEKASKQLEALNLPKNMLTKTLFNAVQKAGVNSNMLRVLLELINALNQQQTNVVVNNNMDNPIERLTEPELRALADRWEGEKQK